jgi:hypothetical protein
MEGLTVIGQLLGTGIDEDIRQRLPDVETTEEVRPRAEQPDSLGGPGR